MNADEYLAKIEEGLESISRQERECVYRTCAIACVKDGVLPVQRQAYEDANHDLDTFYQIANNEYFFSKIIESGHIYEIGYPTCLCPLVMNGGSYTINHCECSRQSILYILHELMPEMKIEVTTLETVLSGAKQCRFRVVIEKA